MKSIFSKMLMVLCITALICCSNESVVTGNEDEKNIADVFTVNEPSENNDNIRKNRKQQLTELAATGNWQSSDEEVQSALLLAFPENVGRGTSPLTIKKIDEANISVQSNINLSRSDITEECSDFKFDLYSLESDAYSGYAVTSNDKRIGNVISIVDSEFQEDISDNDFAIMYAEQLQDYVQETADLWNSITDEDIIKYTSVSRGKSSTGSTSVSVYTYSEWERNYGNNQYEIKTKWDQSPAPYNSCIVAVVGGNAYYVGCGAIQTAQIMAFHKYPNNLTSPSLTTIRNKWAYASTWDGRYDWNILTNVSYPTSWSSKDLQIQIGAFLYDVAQGCKSDYQLGGTYTSDNDTIAYLLSKGYIFDSVSGYSFPKIKQSIDNGCPVPMSGKSHKEVKTYTTTYRFLFWTWTKTTTSTRYYNGHAFIVDGYYNMSCTASNGTDKKKITADYVHVNPGWGGYQNGYYLSGVFDMETGAFVDDNAINSRGTTYGSSKYYKYNLFQVNMLRPKEN